MLRYYDEAGLLKPAKSDPYTGYRFYSAEQIPTLNRIILLRDAGFKISEIGAIIKNWDDDFILRQLNAKHLEIEENIRIEQDKLHKIEMVKNAIKQEDAELYCNISIKNIPAYQVLSLRRIIADYYAEGDLWKEMVAFARKNNIAISDDTFSIYHDTSCKENNVDVELCAYTFEIGSDKNGFKFYCTEAVPTMACVMVSGKFDNIAGAYFSFAKWLQKNGFYEMSSPTRQIVHRGPWNEKNPDCYLVEIQIPLIDSGSKL